MKLLAICVGLALLLCSLPSAACAQQDLAKVLVGKWEGQLAPLRTGRAPIDVNRTLVINEVNERMALGRQRASGVSVVNASVLSRSRSNRQAVRRSWSSNRPLVDRSR